MACCTAGYAQNALTLGGYAPRVVTVLRPAPVPLGGLWPYRQGSQWGYADTTGRLVVAPRSWEAPAQVLPFWGEYGLVNQLHNTPPPAWLPPAGVPLSQLWFNARGEVLPIYKDELAIRQPDGSLRAVPARLAAGLPQMLESEYGGPAPPLLSPERVQVYTGDPRDWVELKKPRYRLDYLEEGRWSLQRYLGVAKHWYQFRPRSRWRGYSRMAVIDKRGHRLTRYRFEEVEKFSQGMARVSLDYSRIGLLDRQGRWLLRPRFQHVTRFSRGLAVARQETRRGYRTGILDSTGRWQWRPHAGWLSNLDEAGLVRASPARIAVGPVSFRRPDGSVPFANHAFRRAGPFWRGRAWVEVAPAQQGLIDEQGRWVTPAHYQLLAVAERMGRDSLRRPGPQAEFLEGKMMFMLDNYNYSRERYFEPQYPETPWLLARREGRYGFVDQRTGREVVPCRYDSVLTVPERKDELQPYACAWRQGRPFVLNMRGQELAEGRYEGRMLTSPDGPRLLLRRPADSTWAAIDTTGRQRTAWLPGGTYWSDGWLLPNNLALVYNYRLRTRQVLDAASGRVLLTARRIEQVSAAGLHPAAAPRGLLLSADSDDQSSQYYDEELRPLRPADLLRTDDVGGGWLAVRPLLGADEHYRLLISPQGQRLELPVNNYWSLKYLYLYSRLGGSGPFRGGVTLTQLGYYTRGGRPLWQP